MISLPARTPSAAGLNDTHILHSSPAGSSLGHSSVAAKSPVTEICETGIGSNPALASMITRLLLVVAETCAPNSRPVSPTAATAMPWPTALEEYKIVAKITLTKVGNHIGTLTACPSQSGAVVAN